MIQDVDCLVSVALPPMTEDEAYEVLQMLRRVYPNLSVGLEET